LHMVTAAFLIVILFLGGWHFWGITGPWQTPDPSSVASGAAAAEGIGWFTALLRIAVLLVKLFLVIVFFMLVRWSWPRFRFDQLMALAWKVMLPLGLINLVAVAVLEQLKISFVIPALGPTASAWLMIIPGFIVAIVAWLAVAFAGPRIADNRPRRELDS